MSRLPKFLAEPLARRRAVAARERANAANRERAWADAVPDYRRYLAWKPDDFAIWVQLGHMLAESGDHDAAEQAYATADALRPGDADLLLCWGHLYRRGDDPDRARDLYRRSFEVDGNAAAEACLVELTPPEPEPEPVPPPFAGTVEHVDGRTVTGWALFGEDVGQEDILFRRDGEIVGRSPLIHPRGEEGFRFAALLDVDGDASVSAHRRSDDVELAGSPFQVRWRPPAEATVLPAWVAPLVVAKPFVPAGDGEVALFVTHSATGLLKPHVLPYLRALADQGIAIFFVAVVDQPIDLPEDLLDLVAGALVRGNAGYDFAAWAHALKLYPELYAARRLYFVNDSMYLAAGGDRFAALIERVRDSDGDLVGLTESREHGWHVQSYFFAVRQRLTATMQFQTFFEDVFILDDKDAVIRAYEVPLAAMVRRIGFAVDVLFQVPIAVNPTLFAWKALLDQGFPFVKLLLLRGAFPDADLSDWRERLGALGVDLGLLDLTIRACDERLPQGALAPQLGLVESGAGHSEAGGPLKVDFYGPWNYDSGLAAASRGLVAALRRTGVRLNLHPIRKPFHVHRPFTPPVDIDDFAGAADIALVHLNPDSWHLLTEDQVARIRSAKKRIGYWVWEMGHIPAAWWADFRSVDRIWTASHYNAELFAAHADVPVDVIPHAVPVLPPIQADRGAVLADLGLQAEDRILLYVFDGASYLVRKNPASLVRGFAASGLAARGWKLVLKTKHLMDRPADGAAFRALAESVEGVVLVDRSLAPAALRALVETADLYASTHCSEGFGLTIAEAMAAGRPVIATDFGGSRDFLDAGSGYPVRAHDWVLEEDFAHYTLGGRWGRIDEPALAATLVRAADAVEAGDSRIGDAARQRIAEQLSYDAVAASITQSFAATVAPPPAGEPHPPLIDLPRFRTDALVGLPPDRVDFGPRFHMLAVRPDGTPDPDRLGLPEDLPADRDHWVVIAPSDGRLHPLLPRLVEAAARDRPDVAIFYADDVANLTDKGFDQIRLKPAFDLTLLSAQDYIGAPLIVRASAFASLGGLRSEAATAACLDLVLRAFGAGLSIERITEVMLVQPDTRMTATRDDHARVLGEQPFAAPYDVVPGRPDGSLMLRRRFAGDQPPVTLLIPTCRSVHPGSGRAHLELLLDRIATTDWPMDRLTVIVGDDVAGEPDWATKPWPFALRRIETLRGADEPFSYARKMNLLWRAAETEHLVLMNDDVRPEQPGWLAALMTFAMDEGVGGVGARLLYEDGRLQHAGIIPHLRAICHAWLSRRPEHGSYQHWADVHREWSMITGAVFATRRAAMEQVDGFDEAFALEYNDVDLCLRMRALGFRLIVTPDAEMAHVEKASRGPGVPQGSELARFLSRWGPWLEQDPAWHPKLRRDAFDLLPQDDPGAWYRI